MEIDLLDLTSDDGPRPLVSCPARANEYAGLTPAKIKFSFPPTDEYKRGKIRILPQSAHGAIAL